MYRLRGCTQKYSSQKKYNKPDTTVPSTRRQWILSVRVFLIPCTYIYIYSFHFSDFFKGKPSLYVSDKLLNRINTDKIYKTVFTIILTLFLFYHLFLYINGATYHRSKQRDIVQSGRHMSRDEPWLALGWWSLHFDIDTVCLRAYCTRCE